VFGDEERHHAYRALGKTMSPRTKVDKQGGQILALRSYVRRQAALAARNQGGNIVEPTLPTSLDSALGGGQ
jgi:hypothetical protein